MALLQSTDTYVLGFIDPETYRETLIFVVSEVSVDAATDATTVTFPFPVPSKFVEKIFVRPVSGDDCGWWLQ